ncbi:MAG TPA: 50S ribosomal protein L19 [Candidatus Paceibacterota bacterium]
MDKLSKFADRQTSSSMPEFRVGDTVRVHQKIKEGDKERTQIFEGLVISKKHGKGASATFKVRKVTSGVGVERTYPLHSPFISKVEVSKSSKVRRAKLYFVRTAKGKRSRFKEYKKTVEAVQPESADQAVESSI